MEVTSNKNSENEFIEEVKKFAATKTGVKELVDSRLVKLHRIFIQPPFNSNRVASLTVPLIDLKGIDDDRRRTEIVNEIREAAEKWGIFLLINHRVSTDVIGDVLEGVKKFHEQPIEVKNEFAQHDAKQLVKFSTAAKLNLLD